MLLIPCLRYKSSAMSQSPPFPSTLEGFGYRFVEGKLTKLGENGEPTQEGFTFVDQAHYEALGEVINKEVYNLLESEAGLERVPLGTGKPKSFIFSSKDYASSERLLIFIHGGGVVRAGQWARRLIINEDLEKGTMLPFISHALNTGWGVIVMNTNLNIDEETGEVIPGSEKPERHGQTVWNNVVAQTRAKKIVIIAHSNGGIVTMHLARLFKSDFMERVFGVFLTDSTHYQLTDDDSLNRKLIEMGKNYVASDEVLGTPIIYSRSSENDIPMFSAGHNKHEWTSWASKDKIFEDLKDAEDFKEVTNDKQKITATTDKSKSPEKIEGVQELKNDEL